MPQDSSECRISSRPAVLIPGYTWEPLASLKSQLLGPRAPTEAPVQAAGAAAALKGAHIIHTSWERNRILESISQLMHNTDVNAGPHLRLACSYIFFLFYF